eukprot:TRINITY_DN7269_c0_g1_i1.p1 TRINITY_DN7269_c0_g1~~TRINITY_DN7269_c0_g1_i1.p1  ORF type:complete len:234 (-),score=33.58 TRINITY_DN7269_c0_g1_i1:64-765(-)
MELFGKMGILTNVVIMVAYLILLRSMWRYRNLEEALSFYGAYHQDPVNQAIHFVFVPILLWSFLLCFAQTPVLGIKVALPGGHPISWATLVVIAYVAFYCFLDPITGSIYSVIILAMYISAIRILERDRYGTSKKSDQTEGSGSSYPMRLFAIAQILGWYMQLHPGHGIFEGVKPALLDGLGQSFSVAPLFAFYEGVWLLGLRPELQAQTANLVALRRAEMCATAGASFRFCS